MKSDGLKRLDTPTERDIFRSEYYLSTYNLALGITGVPDAAKDLTDRVLERAIHRFSGRPLPVDCTPYLIAQVYLLYAKRDTGPASTPSVAEKSAGSAEQISPAFTAEKPAGSAEQISPAPAAVTPQESAGQVSPAPAAVKPAEPATATVPNDDAVSTELETPQVVYDSSITEFWVPSLEGTSRTEEPPANLPPYREWQIAPEDFTPDQPSSRLSVLNTLLALACIVALVFLLISLGAFYSIK